MSMFWAVILLGVLIFVHELGHFLMCKLLGVTVERFSIGLGPKVFGWKSGETEYMLAAIPFGGYVKMLGESTTIEDIGAPEAEGGETSSAPVAGEPVERELTDEEKTRAFSFQPVWKRFLIVFMGPMFNIIFAALIFFAVFVTVGEQKFRAEVGNVAVNSPASEAGLQTGDLVLEMDGQPIHDWFDMTELIGQSKGAPIRMKIQRAERTLMLTAAARMTPTKNIFGQDVEAWILGVSNPQSTFYDKIGIFEAAHKSVYVTFRAGDLIIDVLVKIVQRVIPADNIGGPILIFQMAGQQAEKGAVDFLFLMAMISVNLGLLNLLPVPVLDGGHILFMGIEALRRKPLSEQGMMMAQKVGMALLLALMVFAVYNDIVRLVTGKSLP